MASGRENRSPKKPGEPTHIVVLDYESTKEAEDRLLQVYEFLLGLPDGPEIRSEGEELT